MAITPSSPAPSKRLNQSAAVARSVVAGVRWIGGFAPREALLEQRAPLAERHVAQVAVAVAEQIEEDDRRRDLRRQQLHARRRRVNALLQHLEVERPSRDDDDLAVEDAALGQLGAQRLDQLGEVAVERLFVAALDA